MIEQIQTPATASGNESEEKKPEIKALDPPKEPEKEFFDTETLSLFQTGNGRLRATVAGEKSYLDVRVVRCFPQTIPDQFWALVYNTDTRAIGVIENPEELDEKSLETALQNLEMVYFRPEITRVISMKEEFGAVYFEVETDRGPRSFVSKGVREALTEDEVGTIILSDVNENRYAISDWQNLDRRSQKFLERIL